jgi:transposase
MTQTTKKQQLKEQGALNRRATKVKDPIFLSNPFFDPSDLVQVKYEMVRQVTQEGKSVVESTTSFGMSRPTFYQAKEALEQSGVLGLAPQKTGPKDRHKLNSEIMSFIAEKITENEELQAKEITELVKKHFPISITQRSVNRALAAKKKISAS